MGRRWIEDDPLDAGVTLAQPADELRAPGIASVLGLGPVVSVLVLVVTVIALVD
ncbi:hypothetical protein [Aeromicrobium sp. Sec7.5]|uniref:hypothetical protein n=1 Tax=Aeromicrobium sp. Sec7.5 TaxID=3121276 RepID=UPI002FE4D7C9